MEYLAVISLHAAEGRLWVDCGLPAQDLLNFSPSVSSRPFAAIRKGSIDSHPKASFDCSHKAIRITHFQNQSREVHGVPAQRGAYGHAAASPTDGHWDQTQDVLAWQPAGSGIEGKSSNPNSGPLPSGDCLWGNEKHFLKKWHHVTNMWHDVTF